MERYSFKLKIAGRVAGVCALFQSTPLYFREYLCQEEADFSVEVSPRDLALEQQLAIEEAHREGLKVRIFSDPFLERSVILRKVSEALLDYQTLVFHGSAVALDGRGYLFTAKCRTGKSTHTRFWREVFGPRAVMINDDKPFLKLQDGKIWICGSPWTGKHGIGRNITLPLQAICILERGVENRIEKITGREAAPMLLDQSSPPLDPEKAAAYQELLHLLEAQGSFYRLCCTKDPQAAVVAAAAMHPENLPPIP